MTITHITLGILSFAALIIFIIGEYLFKKSQNKLRNAFKNRMKILGTYQNTSSRALDNGPLIREKGMLWQQNDGIGLDNPEFHPIKVLDIFSGNYSKYGGNE